MFFIKYLTSQYQSFWYNLYDQGVVKIQKDGKTEIFCSNYVYGSLIAVEVSVTKQLFAQVQDNLEKIEKIHQFYHLS